MTIKQYIISANASEEEKILEDLGDIYALGIQAVPGTTFSLLGNNVQQQDAITIGPSGIYQLNLSTPLITGIQILDIVGTIPVIIDLVLEEQKKGS